MGPLRGGGLVAGLQVTGGVSLRVIVGTQKPSLLFGFIDPYVEVLPFICLCHDAQAHHSPK